MSTQRQGDLEEAGEPCTRHGSDPVHCTQASTLRSFGPLMIFVAVATKGLHASCSGKPSTRPSTAGVTSEGMDHPSIGWLAMLKQPRAPPPSLQLVHVHHGVHHSYQAQFSI